MSSTVMSVVSPMSEKYITKKKTINDDNSDGKYLEHESSFEALVNCKGKFFSLTVSV